MTVRCLGLWILDVFEHPYIASLAIESFFVESVDLSGFDEKFSTISIDLLKVKYELKQSFIYSG